MPRLPRIGLSCLSLKDLYEDRVLLQGPSTTPNNLPFVKLLPMLDEDKKLIPWARVKPRKGQTFTVSLELVESTNLRVGQLFIIFCQPQECDFFQPYDFFQSFNPKIISAVCFFNFFLTNFLIFSNEFSFFKKFLDFFFEKFNQQI